MKSLFNNKSTIYIISSAMLLTFSNNNTASIIKSNEKRDVILIICYDSSRQLYLKQFLHHEYQVVMVQETDSALQFVQQNQPRLVIFDISFFSLKIQTNNDLIERIQNFNPYVKLILICDENQVRFDEMGNHDCYHYWLIENCVQFFDVLRNIFYIQQLEIKNENLEYKLTKNKKFDDLLGECPKMCDVFHLIERVINTDVPVLLIGENGTGKHLIASIIHCQSHRRNGAFMPINCGAIAEDLFESEFFGHEKGCFEFQKIGKFELAHRGTVLLSEIDKLNQLIQTRLVNFLVNREIIRQNSEQRIYVDVRLITATNRNLADKVACHEFRPDLYYKLSVVTIQLPSLRDRGDDISLIAHWYLSRYAKEFNKENIAFDTTANEKMNCYQWPGNVSELKNRIKRAVILNQNGVITCGDLGLPESSGKRRESLTEIVDNIQRKYIIDALSRTQGNISRAAKELGISRISLYNLLNRYNFEVNKYRTNS